MPPASSTGRAADMQAKFQTTCPDCQETVLPHTSISKIGQAWGHTRCAAPRPPRHSTHKGKLKKRTPPPQRIGGTRALADKQLHQMISRQLGDWGRER